MNENNQPAQPAKDKLDATTPGWERSVLEKLALATVNEQRASRRWGIFFKIATLALVLFALWHLFELGGADMETLGRHVALIEIDGEIGEEGTGAADVVIPALNKAYNDAGSVGIVLSINSPGGSPVQAGLINDEMTRLRRQFPNKPLYVVVGEMCASGGYYIAAGADRIYVNKASVVGSIGVLMEGFGFTELMKKLGVERRLLTAGENKGLLDPYSPQTEKQKAYAQAMLNEIHQQFIAVVRAGRGKRLKESPEMFSGCSGPAARPSRWAWPTAWAASTAWRATCSRPRT
jgi:protease-4